MTNDTRAQDYSLRNDEDPGRDPDTPLREDEGTKRGLLPCVSRRQFLFMGAAAVSIIALERVLPRGILYAQTATFDRQRIAALSDLEVGVPVAFNYPYEHPNALNNLIKLGVPAGGGIGPDDDIVAFNALCPHMGGQLMGTYKAEHKAIGPCPFHLTTFDLKKHGMVIAGHATESLPQILLEVEGDEIYATGVLGLIYGRASNLVG